MKRHIVLLGALMLSGGLAGSQAFASPEPQAITQSSGTVSGTLVDEKGEPIIEAFRRLELHAEPSRMPTVTSRLK